MYYLTEVVVLWREEEDEMVERNRTEKVEDEPRLEVVDGNLVRFQDDFVGKLVGDDTWWWLSEYDWPHQTD